jgi:hypothetical protein
MDTGKRLKVEIITDNDNAPAASTPAASTSSPSLLSRLAPSTYDPATMNGRIAPSSSSPLVFISFYLLFLSSVPADLRSIRAIAASNPITTFNADNPAATRRVRYKKGPKRLRKLQGPHPSSTPTGPRAGTSARKPMPSVSRDQLDKEMDDYRASDPGY